MQARLPKFIEIGNSKIEGLFSLLNERRLDFNKVMVFGDRKTFILGGNRIVQDLQSKEVSVSRFFVENSDEVNLNKAEAEIARFDPDLIIGFGGGKVLDVAKCSSGNKEKIFISMPTTLSNDGIASPVAVIKTRKNIPLSHFTRPAYGVVVDLKIIKKAPARFIRAGVGDLLSNLSAAFDARLAQSRGRERISEYAVALAEKGALDILELNDYSIKSDDFLRVLAGGLIKSGFAMCLYGSSRPASGSEHKISHSLDFLYPGRDVLHGEQVGIATIFTMALQKNRRLNGVIKLYKAINFPRRLRYLNINKDQFVDVVLKARKFRPGRFTVLEAERLNHSRIKGIIKTIHL